MTKILSIGGSVLIDEKIDTEFILELKEICNEQTIMVVGGGKTAREYINAAGNASDIKKDWLGIKATQLNAYLVSILLDGTFLKKPLQIESDLIIGCGLTPGNSTDYVACLYAKLYNATEVINVTNVSHVYDKDPKLKDAKPIPEMTWDDFFTVFDTKWKPGLNAPFDPVAGEYCKENSITVKIVKKDIDTIKKALAGEEYDGTIIRFK